MLLHLRLDEVQPGMRLARSLVAPDGVLFLAAGVTLNEWHLARLRAMGFRSLHVTDGGLDGVEVGAVVAEQTREATIAAVRAAMARAAAGRPLDAALIRETIDLLAQDVLNAPGVIVGLLELKAASDHTFAHSGAVAALCLMVGRLFDLPRGDLVELGIGALLHDIGKASIPPEILLKPGPLTAAEMERVRRHPVDGFAMLRRNFPVSLRAAHVAYQHHERLDGSGYPRGLKGDEMHLFARICAACDTFDAMTSDRIYAAAQHPVRALGYLQQEAPHQFDRRVTLALGRIVPPYPVGSLVLLSNGEVAVVKALDPADASRPVLRRVRRIGIPSSALQDADIDLSQHPGLHIEGPVLWSELGRFSPGEHLQRVRARIGGRGAARS